MILCAAVHVLPRTPPAQLNHNCHVETAINYCSVKRNNQRWRLFNSRPNTCHEISTILVKLLPNYESRLIRFFIKIITFIVIIQFVGLRLTNIFITTK